MNHVTLGSICDVTMGQAPAGSSYNTDGIGLPLLAGAGDFGVDYPKPAKFTNEPTAIARQGDLILCIRATIGDLNWADKEYCLGRGVAGLRPRRGSLDRSYLWHWLRMSKTELQRKARGSTFKQIARKDITELDILLPKDMKEQFRIASILDKAEAIRRKCNERLTLSDQFVRSAFFERFGDPVSNSKCLPTAPIKDLARVVTGNTPPRKDPSNYGPGIEWIKSDNINSPLHFVTQAEETLSAKGRSIGRVAPAGATLVTCIAGSPNSIGNCALTNRDIAFNQQINAAIPHSSVDPFFLYCQFLVGKHLIQNASTKSMKGMVSKGKFQEIQFLKPSFPDQKEFGKLFQKVIQTMEALGSQVSESETLYAGLEQRAFQGKL